MWQFKANYIIRVSMMQFALNGHIRYKYATSARLGVKCSFLGWIKRLQGDPFTRIWQPRYIFPAGMMGILTIHQDCFQKYDCNNFIGFQRGLLICTELLNLINITFVSLKRVLFSLHQDLNKMSRFSAQVAISSFLTRSRTLLFAGNSIGVAVFQFNGWPAC